MGVNILTDEIAFYPVLYWPVLPDAEPLPEPTLAKIDAYMKQGGMIVFDTQDYGRGLPTGLPLPRRGRSALQRMLGSLDVPRLEPVPENHVLTKVVLPAAQLPRPLGRRTAVGRGARWHRATAIRAASARVVRRRHLDHGDVQRFRLRLGAAMSAAGRSTRPCGGGEDQREMAFRTGINIVMHALTGNYKADQVHVPALLERLGQ